MKDWLLACSKRQLEAYYKAFLLGLMEWNILCWKVILATALFSVCHMFLQTWKSDGYFQAALPSYPPFYNILEYSVQLCPFILQLGVMSKENRSLLKCNPWTCWALILALHALPEKILSLRNLYKCWKDTSICKLAFPGHRKIESHWTFLKITTSTRPGDSLQYGP